MIYFTQKQFKDFHKFKINMKIILLYVIEKMSQNEYVYRINFKIYNKTKINSIW